MMTDYKMKNRISKLAIGIISLSLLLLFSFTTHDSCHSSKGLPFELSESIKQCSGGVWGKDSKILYYSAKGMLWQYSLESNSKKTITDLNNIQGKPELSADYSRIAFVKNGEIWIMQLKDGSVVNKIKGDIQSGWNLKANADEVVFSGDGNIWSAVSINNQHAYVRKSEEWFGMNELYIDDKMIAKEEGIAWIFSPYDSPIEWSPDGERLYFISERSGWSKIYSVNKNGEDPREETFCNGDDRDFTILSDGALLFVSNRNRSEEWSLWIKKPGRDAEPVFGKGGFISSVSVSPDKEWVSFLYSNPVEPFELYTLNLNSKHLIKISTNSSEKLKNYAIRPKVISFRSGDHEVQGILYLPYTSYFKGEIPTIIRLHGGPSMQDGLNWNSTFQYFATRGYAVLAINYTGSVGYGKEFEEADLYRIGKEDCDDVATAAKYLKSLKEPEIGKIGVMGGSYGGYLTNLVIGRYPHLFNAAVGSFGISDWNTIFEFEKLHPVVRNFFLNRLGNKPEHSDLYFEASPVNYADSIITPLLLMHGDSDIVVPIGQSQEFYNLLKKKGKNVDFIKYEKEGHGWSRKETRMDANKRTEEWFERYLK